MAKPAYRAARGNTAMIIGLVLLAFAGQIGTVGLLGPGQQKNWHVAIFFIPAVVCFIVGYLIARQRHKRRIAGVVKSLAASGFVPAMEPTATQRERLWSLVGHLGGSLGIEGGAEKIRWLAPHDCDADDVWIFETQHITGSGKFSEVHDRTVVAWPASHPDLPGAQLGHLAGFVMARLPWLLRRLYKPYELQDAAFQDLSKRWSIRGNAETGKLFLTPPARAELVHSPNGESWCLGGGWVCCIFRGILDGTDVTRFYERARQLLKEQR